METRTMSSSNMQQINIQKAYATLDEFKHITDVDISNGFNPNIRLILNGAVATLYPLMDREVMIVSDIEISAGLTAKLNHKGKAILDRCSLRKINQYYATVDEHAIRRMCQYQSQNPYLDNFIHSAVWNELINVLYVPHDLINLSIQANYINEVQGIRIPQFTDPFRVGYFNLYQHIYSDSIKPIGLICRKYLVFNYDAHNTNDITEIAKSNKAGEVLTQLNKYVAIDRALMFKDIVDPNNPLMIKDMGIVMHLEKMHNN